jgi:hypothetical protein
VQEPQRINLESIPSEESVGPIALSMRNYFSTNFLWTALHTSRLVGELRSRKGDVRASIWRIGRTRRRL